MKQNKHKKVKVFVGLSGGVDSSVAAALLVEQGYDVTGVYMKNWTQDLTGVKCVWAEDLADAKRVAVQLGIPFKVYDFQREYKQRVVDYMLDEYRAGRTPNPDVMCNEMVKFRLFLDCALADGADFIATGHYAQVGCEQSNGTLSRGHLISNELTSTDLSVEVDLIGKSNVGRNAPRKSSIALLRAVDENKDQTYFLYRVSAEALGRTLFPIGHLTKPEVRAAARRRGLVTAQRKESMGICFVGNVGVREFLSQYVAAESGDIVDERTGEKIGRHDGAIFYTFGQRHGLNVGGGLPYYVVGKDMKKNEVYVSQNLNDENFWREEVELVDVFLREKLRAGKTYQVRVRHRAPLVDAEIVKRNASRKSSTTLSVKFKTPERAIAAGQSIVFYDGELCLGGGIVK
ncbi:MAG: tRNA-specific 2-thiouridylase [Candidatus Nomurabacteria bacterium]|jgi:tRNA-specific 2-thiouridylase|nr:tRNA-specific 2-thiouridylase [Candidatus Nomurabacteria bacterium]